MYIGYISNHNFLRKISGSSSTGKTVFDVIEKHAKRSNTLYKYSLWEKKLTENLSTNHPEALEDGVPKCAEITDDMLKDWSGIISVWLRG